MDCIEEKEPVRKPSEGEGEGEGVRDMEARLGDGLGYMGG